MTDTSDYRVIARDSAGVKGDFEVVAPDGTVLLLTQDVSVQTLTDLCAAHKEKRPYQPRREERRAWGGMTDDPWLG